jgi:hypothetical protein
MLDHYKYVCVNQHWGANKIVASCIGSYEIPKRTDFNKIIIKKYSKVYFNKCWLLYLRAVHFVFSWFLKFYKHNYFTSYILSNLCTGLTYILVYHVYIIAIYVWLWHLKYVFLNKCSVHMGVVTTNQTIFPMDYSRGRQPFGSWGPHLTFSFIRRASGKWYTHPCLYISWT